MSYALALDLQKAVHGRLSADAALAALVAGHVYDAMPPGKLPPLFVLLGDETVRDRSDATARGAEHDVTVSVVSDGRGFAEAKEAAVAVSDALLAPGLTLARGYLVSLRFRRAAARREKRGRYRRIDLVFRARVDED